jgi:2-polyprenyl-3-methyl-5-hydroxy-6-metoxy-1,4-benzoquinol methylase
MSEDQINPASLERIVPDKLSAEEATGAETLRLHLARYEFAARHLVAGSVLDMACGVGYGTAFLVQSPVITRATGVDIDAGSIQYAAERYKNERVAFFCSDAMQFASGKFENIVSLETIEHVADPWALFSHLVSLLKPQGRLIASVPVTPSVDANPHHKTNFSVKTFLRMGEKHALEYIDSMEQVQPFNPIAVARRKEARTVSLRRNIGLFYLKNPSHLLLRLWSTVRDGFANKYITVVWKK